MWLAGSDKNMAFNPAKIIVFYQKLMVFTFAGITEN
jgi:hypothetical protein